jgi:hypothetical protein
MLLSDQSKKSLLKASKLLDKLNIKTSDVDILLYSYILLKYHTKKVSDIKIKQKVKNVILQIEKLLNKIFILF